MTYPEAIQFLYDLRWFGAKLGLANTEKLAALAGNPQERLRFVHVAGTNGKGSTCAMLESIYRAAGLRVGLFTSPHLVAFGERVQVNRQPISQDEIVRQAGEMQNLLRLGWETSEEFLAATSSGHAPGSNQPGPGHPEGHPTFFEVVTVMALRYFAEQKCDLVIWETGLGGRLDATNIVTPLASVITNIQYDHQKWLGETLASIAAEKAGIIKPGVMALTAADEPEALRVIEAKAAAANAPLSIVSTEALDTAPLGSVSLPLLGQHQRLNAALAVATVQALQSRLPVSPEALRSGLEQVQWPGRLQLIVEASGRKVLLDGAHNAAGARMLAVAVREFFPEVEPALVLGILEDKDFQGMCSTLAPLARRIYLVPVQNERTAPPESLLPACSAASPGAEIFPCGSLAEALDRAANEPFLVLAGSLYLVGEALEVLRPRPSNPIGERLLNQWKG